MSWFLSAAIHITLVCYGLAMLLALWRALRGPAAQDRVLAVDFLNIVAMLLMLVVGIRYGNSAYFVPALLVSLFGFVSSTACAKFLLRGEVIE
jgi:multicomponent K+:H+ antiporter subunit F